MIANILTLPLLLLTQSGTPCPLWCTTDCHGDPDGPIVHEHHLGTAGRISVAVYQGDGDPAPLVELTDPDLRVIATFPIGAATALAALLLAAADTQRSGTGGRYRAEGGTARIVGPPR